jgi:5-methylcytosine-specific restriction endonuclease McrA
LNPLAQLKNSAEKVSPSAEYQREWHAAHPGMRALYARRWRERNPEADAAYKARRRKPRVEKQCFCGTVFLVAVGSKTIYCPPHRRTNARTPRRRLIENTHTRFRRVVVRSGERIRLAEIYERDRGLCGICGTAVAAEAKMPDPFSPSLDHILPIARGGLHVRANVRLAHFICNAARGARS